MPLKYQIQDSDLVMLNYSFRLYPTRLQEARLLGALDGCRWVYNYFVANSLFSEYDMNYVLTELKEQEPWLYNYYSKMLQMVSKQVAASNKSLSVLRRKGHKVGRLRYLTHEKYNSFSYIQSGFKIVRHGETDLLWLSKIGYVEMHLHRQPVNIKQVTVVRKINKWYAVVACETANPIFKIIDPRKSVGIDLGITKFVHDSDNHSIGNPLFLTRMLKPLRRAQRRLSRRQNGGSNRKKAQCRLAHFYQRINNRHRDFLHKASRYYSERYDIIFLERLRTLNMAKNHRIARHVLDSGWRMFKAMLEYKAKMVFEVEPYNTSIDCSKCGEKVPKSLAIRTHRCNKCGLVIDRDYNASLNILQKGLRLLPAGRREVTPAEIIGWSGKQEEAHVQRMWVEHVTRVT